MIGAFQKLTLQDYPGRVACIIFTRGCNLRCSYCHNPDLLKEGKNISEIEILNFLENRKNLLDGVVVTGGEPTIHGDLPNLLFKIKKLGYSIKLYTNGTRPLMLKKLTEKNLVDVVAMDYELSDEKSKKIVKESGVEYELRVHSDENVKEKNAVYYDIK